MSFAAVCAWLLIATSELLPLVLCILIKTIVCDVTQVAAQTEYPDCAHR